MVCFPLYVRTVSSFHPRAFRLQKEKVKFQGCFADNNSRALQRFFLNKRGEETCCLPRSNIFSGARLTEIFMVRLQCQGPLHNTFGSMFGAHLRQRHYVKKGEHLKFFKSIKTNCVTCTQAYCCSNGQERVRGEYFLRKPLSTQVSLP